MGALPVVRDDAPCEGCHGRCCAEHRVPVDGFDLVRLLRARGERWPEVVELERVRHPLYFGLRLDDGADHWLIYLRRRDDGACRYLVGPEGAQRCGIYAARPGACRTYPAALDEGRAFVSAHAICPPERAAAWARHLDAGDPTALDDYAARARYAAALERWDRTVLAQRRTLDDFVAFMSAALDSRACGG